MSFFARLMGRQGDNGCGKLAGNSNKRQQPCSPLNSGSFAQQEFNPGRTLPAAPVPVKLQNGTSTIQQQQQQQRRSSVDPDSDDEDCTIRVPGSLSCSSDRNRSNSLARRRAAIDISPRAVQRLSDKVALLDAGHMDVDGGAVTRCEVEALYTDMQLIHRGRSSMVYRAREVRSSRRVILKSYDAHSLSNAARKRALERQILTLRAAQAAAGPHSGLVTLERVVENTDGTYLVVQACNGGTLIEAIANSGGKLPERQVAIKVALPLLHALKHLHTTGIVHRDIKPEHLMIHNGGLHVGDFGSAGCASYSAASLANTLQKQALAALSKRQQQQQRRSGDRLVPSDQQIDQQQLMEQLQQQQQLHLQADCTAEATLAQPQQQPGCTAAAAADPQTEQQQAHVARFGVAADMVSGTLSPGVSGRLSVQAVKDAMNFRIGSIEYMAPEMLDKPTAAEVFHLVIAQGIDEEDLPTYDDKVDIWSTGVVLFEALSGVQPFLADSAADMLDDIGRKLAKRLEEAEQQQQHHQHHDHHHQHHQQQHHQHWSHQKQAQELPAFIARLAVSADAKDFLAACLTWDPAARPGADVLLRHPWLQRMQEEAALVAASRASSRRISMQVSMQRAAAAAARLSESGGAGDAAAGAAAAAAGVSLVDPMLAGMLQGHEADERRAALVDGYSRQTSLDLTAHGLERSQTAEQLEVGMRNVLRTNTQRLETRPLSARVHAA